MLRYACWYVLLLFPWWHNYRFSHDMTGQLIYSPVEKWKKNLRKSILCPNYFNLVLLFTSLWSQNGFMPKWEFTNEKQQYGESQPLTLKVLTTAEDYNLFIYISFFPETIRLDITCDLSSEWSIHMKCQVFYFLWKKNNKKKQET